MIGYVGLDAGTYLRCKDPLERAALEAVTQRLLRLRERHDQQLAVLIANAVGRMLGGR